MTNQTAMPELKPCPFCGGEPILNHIEAHTHHLTFDGKPLMPDYPGSWTIECCDVGMIKDTREEVVTAWNRRALSQQGEDALRMALEAMEEAARVIEALKPAEYGNGTIVRLRRAHAALSAPLPKDAQPEPWRIGSPPEKGWYDTKRDTDGIEVTLWWNGKRWKASPHSPEGIWLDERRKYRPATTQAAQDKEHGHD